MKLLIVTVVEEFAKETLKLFKKANIESFSGSDIDGYKNPAQVLMASNWFPSEKGGVESAMFFPLPQKRILKSFFNLFLNSTIIWKPTIP